LPYFLPEHLSNRRLSAMSPFTPIPAAAITLVISFLLPLLLPATGGDVEAAKSVALALLSEYQPRTARELRLAGEAIVSSLKGLSLLALSGEPGIDRETLDTTLKWATSLSRSSHAAQRRLDTLQRLRRASLQPDAEPLPALAQADPPAPMADAPRTEADGGRAVTTAADVPSADLAAAGLAQSDEAQSDLAQAEAAFTTAEARLAVMKGWYKGGPAPHSTAAQQIRTQTRLVEAARLKLAQARKRRAESGSQFQPDQVAA
jgi:hypothetical protein